ncbi:MAG TPA: STAS domain-containing protein [Kofleriaceae bacterium]|nr:STAS domain-containing protein [Kofleriaceae bacterium]
MSQKFQASVHHRDDLSFVKLAGVIDEDNELTELTDKIHGSTVVIDLGEVDRINSCGVRDWVNWLGRVEAKNVDVVLVECSPAIVAQINLVNNFTGSGVVKSFYVPYFCPECDEEKVLLCETGDMGPPPHEPPICRCDECDLVMDFDDMPDSYFAFLANQRRIVKPERIQSLLDEFNPGDDEKSKIRSRVGSGSLSGANLSSQSLPTVPSLPSISRTSTPGSRPSTSFSHIGSTPGMASSSSGIGLPPEMRGGGAVMVRSSGPLVFALVAVLLVAIAALAVLLLSN